MAVIKKFQLYLDCLDIRLSKLIVVAAGSIMMGCTTTSARDFKSADVIILAPHVSVSEELVASAEGVHPGSFRICFGPEGDRYAFARRDAQNWVVVLDGVPGEQFETLFTRKYATYGWLYPGFSKDCARFTYSGFRDGLWHIVINQEIEPGSFAAEPESHLEAIARMPVPMSQTTKSLEGARVIQKDRERFVVVDGKELKHYSTGAAGGTLEAIVVPICAFGSTDCRFVPDGPFEPIYSDEAKQRIGYRVKQGGNVIYVVDEVEYGPYGTSLGYDSHIKFGPNGNHFAFQAKRGKRAILNVDGIDVLSMPLLQFRESGALANSDIYFPYRFVDSNLLQTFAIKKNQLVRLTVDIAE